jgi:ubiquinone/menaquinone biosynthesis C-methylase UbiE
MRTNKNLEHCLTTKTTSEFPHERSKEFAEVAYWNKIKRKEGKLSNQHYKYFYTTHFGLNAAYYHNKTILDIGCGPRGSLEWASMASRRFGLDPLAKEYLKLGADQHQMEYIDSPSENIPLKDAECDAVFSFNSLDHVDDVEQTLKEIKRITRPGGIFLLLVEVNHPPTACEPHQLTPRMLIESLKTEFICESVQAYSPTDPLPDIYAHHSLNTHKHTREPATYNSLGLT